MMTRSPTLLVAMAAIVLACSGKRPTTIPMPSAQATCYEVRYTPDSASVLFPRFLALDPGGTNGTAFWLPASSDSLGVQRLFYRGSWLRPSPDSIRFRFGALTIVELSTVARSDSLQGLATWYSDSQADPPPRAVLVAIRRACRDLPL